MKTWQILIIVLLVAGISSVIGYSYGRRTVHSPSLADTICFRDTIRDSIPYPVVETIIQEVPELFPVYITMEGDTIHEPVYDHWIASGFIRRKLSSERNLEDGELGLLPDMVLGVMGCRLMLGLGDIGWYGR